MANPSITLAVYEIRLRKYRDKTDYYNIDDFDYGNDLYDFIMKTIGNWHYKESEDKAIVNDEDKQKVIRLVPDTIRVFGRRFTAFVETGDYGTPSTIIDNKTGEIKYEKVGTDADVLPFYVMFYIPKGAKSAIMITQRFKQYGAATIIIDTIRKEFTSKFADVYFEASPLMSSELTAKYATQGEIKKITFRSFNSNFLKDNPSIPELNTDEYSLEFSIISKRGKKIGIPLSRFRSDTEKEGISKLVAIPGYDYNEISVNIVLNGHRRTLKMNDVDNLGSFFDITEDVIFSDNGLPTYDSIDKQAVGILDDIKL